MWVRYGSLVPLSHVEALSVVNLHFSREIVIE